MPAYANTWEIVQLKEEVIVYKGRFMHIYIEFGFAFTPFTFLKTKLSISGPKWGTSCLAVTHTWQTDRCRNYRGVQCSAQKNTMQCKKKKKKKNKNKNKQNQPNVQTQLRPKYTQWLIEQWKSAELGREVAQWKK